MFLYDATAIYSAGGYIFSSKKEALKHALDAMDVMRQPLGDWELLEWHNSAGVQADPRALFQSENEDDVRCLLEQINDQAFIAKNGYIRFTEYQDFFDLVEKERIEEWGDA